MERMDRVKGWLDELVDAESRVLDLGCGNGLYTAYLAERCREAVGVEIDQESLACAEEHERATYVCSSWDELPDLGHFDLALATEVLEHSLDPGQIIRSIDADRWFITVPIAEEKQDDPWDINSFGHVQAFREESLRALVSVVERYEEHGPYGYLVGRP
jgi:SAM-dependent methyltransferase